MRLYNHYLTILALLFGVTTVLLAGFGQQRFDFYLSMYLIEYLMVTLLLTYLHPRARRLLSMLASIFFGGFMVVVTMEVSDLFLAAFVVQSD